jgi:hypothetical protein
MTTDFASLLQPEFAWPATGDQVFTSSDNWNDAVLADDPEQHRMRMATMVTGYKGAADALVDQAGKGTAERDSLVYPIVFLYRHYIELELKQLIWIYGPKVGVEPNWKSHDIRHLWALFTKMTKAWSVIDEGDAEKIVGRHVAAFAKLDPGSFSFRYTMDTDGEPMPIGRDRLDLNHLRDIMKTVDAFFVGTDGYLDALDGAMDWSADCGY